MRFVSTDPVGHSQSTQEGWEESRLIRRDNLRQISVFHVFVYFHVCDNGDMELNLIITQLPLGAFPLCLCCFGGARSQNLEKYHRRQICVCLNNCEQTLKLMNIFKLSTHWSRCRSHRANAQQNAHGLHGTTPETSALTLHPLCQYRLPHRTTPQDKQRCESNTEK